MPLLARFVWLYIIFSNSTAIGGDNFHLRRLANLPDVALEHMGMLFKQSLAALKVPMQDLFNIMVLLGKKQAGPER